VVKLDESILEEYSYLVARVAYDYARKYKMVSVDDVKQELWVWFYEHPNKVKQWKELDEKETTKLIARSLRNAAHDYCQKEKAQSAGYQVDDNFYYQRELIEVLLPSVLTGDLSIAKTSDLGDGSRSSKSPGEGGNWMVYLIDLQKAYSRLQEQHQRVLQLRYAQNLLGSDLGAVLGCSPDAARKRVEQALKKLVMELGGFKPYPDRDYKTTE
jgi:RNA polymerase sigma factor (sigma-70 family)